MNTILRRGRHSKKSLYQSIRKNLSICAALAITGGLVLVPQISNPTSIANAAEKSASSTASSDPMTSAEPTWTKTVTVVPTDAATTDSPVAVQSAGSAVPSETPESTDPSKSPEVPESMAPANPNKTTDPSKNPEAPESVEAVDGSESAATTEEIKQGEDIAVPMTVPVPPSGSAVVSVKIGGDRRANGTVTPLAGVKLGLYGPGGTTTGGGPGAASSLPIQGSPGARYNASWTWTTCVSDADGDCNFVIPIRSGTISVTGVPQDTRFWVAQEASPAGWYANPTLRIGGFGAAPDGTWSYRFRTDTQLRANTTYRSTTAMPWNDPGDNGVGSGDPDRYFMRNRVDANTEGWYAANATRTTGVWNQSRDNPVFPAKCGINVALIADTSGSLGPIGIAELKSSMGSFVDAFRGTDTNMSLFSFSNESPGAGATNHSTLLPVTTAAQGATFKSQYASWISGGGTNWDRGLAEAANATAKYDLAILLTDGNPTVIRDNSGAGSSAYNSLQDTDAGIFSANQLKAEGTRVVALGVGPALTTSSEYNLRAVSGPTKGSDYIRTNSFADATAALVALANANCAGSIEVQKMIVPANGSIADATPAPAGWKFDASSKTATMTVDAPTSKTTVTGGNGKVDFGLKFTPPSTSGTVQILETQQDGYEILPVGTGTAARNATCEIIGTGAKAPVQDSGTAAKPGFTVTGLKDQRVSCKIYNKVLAPGKLGVSKSSDPASGTTVTPGQTLTYTLTFKNTGQMPATVDQEDVLTGVLDDAALVAGSISAQPPLAAVLNGAGNRIKVTGELAPSDTKTVTYKVKVKDPLTPYSDGTLGNFVVKTGENPPPTCEPEEPCTVHPVRVTLSWNKVDPSGSKLKGSEWKLVPLKSDGTPDQASAIAVQDCVEANTAACTGADKDPAFGAFLLTGLVPGKYWLVETKAPAGYQLLEQEIELVVNTNLGFGDIENDLVVVPVLPLTGGMGSYLFTGGALICVVFVVAALLLQRRQVRIRVTRN